ncbi:DIS3-like exonuclease 2 [Bulinus truncatus]|nr:DIS3-like exonuclease 2 [Bulinus truncatus]
MEASQTDISDQSSCGHGGITDDISDQSSCGHGGITDDISDQSSCGHGGITDDISDQSSCGHGGITDDISDQSSCGHGGITDDISDQSSCGHGGTLRYIDHWKPDSAAGVKNKSTKPRKKIPVVELTKTGDRDIISLVTGGHHNGDLVQKKGKVVYILQEIHSREVMGSLQIKDINDRLASLIPADHRIPKVKILMRHCPLHLRRQFKNLLFKTRIPDWSVKEFLPMGSEPSLVGQVGDISAETQSILLKHNIDNKDCPKRVKAFIQDELPRRISRSELGNRVDLRKLCAFTIDSKDSEDIDDALSIEIVKPGIYKVYVHISDVSYYVKENSDIDLYARECAVTTYLENQVLNMLPEELSENICSLIPEQDRLAFSIIWTMNEEGDVLDEEITKSVVRSCAKLTYDIVQNFIEARLLNSESFSIGSPFTTKDVVQRVQLLDKIGFNLRKKRVIDGALIFENQEIVFKLNKQTGKPTGYTAGRNNYNLVQEFMVLANKCVARKIQSTFPDKAILRLQPEPRKAQLEKMAELCRGLGVPLNISSSALLQKSIDHFEGEDERSMRLALSKLLIKSMQKSKLVCTGMITPETSTHHYSLNTSCYTDFTSPIRRYSDILVHRLLAASIGFSSLPSLSPEEHQKALDHYSRKNTNANAADSDSVDLFLSHLIKETGPLQEKGIVTSVMERALEVLLVNLSVTRKVFLKDLPAKVIQYNKGNNCPELIIEWPADAHCDHITRHKLKIFSQVDCQLTCTGDNLKCLACELLSKYHVDLQACELLSKYHVDLQVCELLSKYHVDLQACELLSKYHVDLQVCELLSKYHVDLQACELLSKYHVDLQACELLSKYHVDLQVCELLSKYHVDLQACELLSKYHVDLQVCELLSKYHVDLQACELLSKYHVDLQVCELLSKYHVDLQACELLSKYHVDLQVCELLSKYHVDLQACELLSKYHVDLQVCELSEIHK